MPQRRDWRQVRIGRDLLAGLMVGLVALPLAVGFRVSSGVGAEAGLVTAIVAGTVAAVFGGSRFQVSGPTGAMTVVLVPIVADFADGVLVVGLLAGVVLVGLAYARAGRFIPLRPRPGRGGLHRRHRGHHRPAAGPRCSRCRGPRGQGGGPRVPRRRRLGGGPPSGCHSRSPRRSSCSSSPWAGSVPAGPASLLAVVAATALNSSLGWGAAPIGAIPAGLPPRACRAFPGGQVDS